MKPEFWTLMDSSPRRATALAEQAEQEGWDGVAVYDSQNLDGDCYVSLTQAAAATQTLGLGTGVTNPFTRHPVVAAGAMASIQEISDGRAVLGIGRGDSALAHLGHAPVYPQEFERYLEALQTYLSRGAVAFDDLTFSKQMAPPVETLGSSDIVEDSRLEWLSPEDEKVPVEVAASGPKVISAAARHADNVIFALGSDPNRIQWGLDQARRAREKAGLPPDGIKYGVYLNIVCHPQVDVARELLSLLSTFIRFSAMHGSLSGPASQGDVDVFKELNRSFSVREHASNVAPPSDFVDRFAVVGPPDICIKRIEELAGLGIEKVIVVGPTIGHLEGESARASELLTREVLPAFSD